MSDLDDAIREHLELKRRRGADPAEVAREEQEALSPVTRSHAVVAPAVYEPNDAQQAAPPSNGGAQHDGEPGEPQSDEELLSDATQEFRVEHGSSRDDWLADVDD